MCSLTFPLHAKNLLVSYGKNKRNEERNKAEDLKFYKKQSPRGVL